MAKSYTRLSFEERLAIQEGLALGESVSEIARGLNRNPTTVSAEIKRNRQRKRRKRFRGTPVPNICSHKHTCSVKGLCGSKKCRRRCAECKYQRCGNLCKSYQKEICRRITRAPYVCTACPRFTSSCSHRQYIYDAKVANAKTEALRAESRSGLDISQEDFATLDALVTPLVQRGQPLAHIYAHHKSEIPVSIRSLYRFCEAGYFSFSKMHLTRAVRYKVRDKDDKRPCRERQALKARRYSDFLELSPLVQAGAVECDTVHGCQGGPVIFTLMIRRYALMLMFLIPGARQAVISERLSYLEYLFGDAFEKVFAVLLADRGSEFINPDEIELSPLGEKRCSVYYCDPCAPHQKGMLERNHEYIRRYLPKGTSFAGLTERDVALMCSHINSASRPSLGGASPLELAPPYLLEKLAKLGVTLVSPDDVTLNKTLIS